MANQMACSRLPAESPAGDPRQMKLKIGAVIQRSTPEKPVSTARSVEWEAGFLNRRYK